MKRIDALFAQIACLKDGKERIHALTKERGNL